MVRIIGTCLVHRNGVYRESAVGLHEPSGTLFAGMSAKRPTRFLKMMSGGSTSAIGYRWSQLVTETAYTETRLGALVAA